MAAPVYQAAGAGATGTTSVAVPYPTGIAAGHLLLLQVFGFSSTTITVGTPAGWSIVAEQGRGGQGHGIVFAKSASGSESGTLTVTPTGTPHTIKGRMYRITGWKNDATMANNWESIAFTAESSTITIADAGITTTGADRLACNFVFVNDDNFLDAFTGQTGGTWAEAVAEYTDATNQDMALGFQIATMASSGTIDGGTDTMAATDVCGVIGFAILPFSASAFIAARPFCVRQAVNRASTY